MSLNMEYLAGLMDGEGYFTIEAYSPRGSLILLPKIGIGMKTESIIRQIKEKYGGSFYTDKFKDGRVCYHVRWNIADSKTLAKLLLPYLIIKRRQAEIIISFPYRRNAAQIRYTNEENQVRYKLTNEMRELNIKNGKGHKSKIVLPSI